MSRGAAFRGQPLLLLVTLLAGWFGLRTALWQPWPEQASGGLLRAIAVQASQLPAAAPAELLARFAPSSVPAASSARFRLPETVAMPAGARTPPHLPTQVIIGHNLLLAAGLAQMELPPFLAAYLQDAPSSPGMPAAAPSPADLQSLAMATTRGSPLRWTADGWVMLRPNSEAGLAPGRPTYGRSQAGGVVRYSLAPASAHRPQAYLRASSALSGPREREAAAGFSVRPLDGLPLRLAAEARVSETTAGTELRPAAYVVTELPPVRLPLDARGEVYAQAGYVGGRFATAFVDGQARAERPLARWGETELSAGAGIWGGAQKGSARLDIGPTAAVAFRLGDTRGRVAADYRFCVAGDAEPASGPALTVSAGF